MKPNTARLVFLSVLLSGIIGRSVAAEPPKPSRCTDAEYRRLDFWVGDWDAFEADDLKGAVSLVQIRLTGLDLRRIARCKRLQRLQSAPHRQVDLALHPRERSGIKFDSAIHDMRNLIDARLQLILKLDVDSLSS